MLRVNTRVETQGDRTGGEERLNMVAKSALTHTLVNAGQSEIVRKKEGEKGSTRGSVHWGCYYATAIAAPAGEYMEV